jgi:hypothetical protein
VRSKRLPPILGRHVTKLSEGGRAEDISSPSWVSAPLKDIEQIPDEEVASMRRCISVPFECQTVHSRSTDYSEAAPRRHSIYRSVSPENRNRSQGQSDPIDYSQWNANRNKDCEMGAALDADPSSRLPISSEAIASRRANQATAPRPIASNARSATAMGLDIRRRSLHSRFVTLRRTLN